nr:hypothetical protein [uncultured Haemophilus sp.]
MSSYEYDLSNVEDHYLYDQIRVALFGVTVGDVLGVPVEFESRGTLKSNPVTEMKEYGTFCLLCLIKNRG